MEPGGGPHRWQHGGGGDAPPPRPGASFGPGTPQHNPQQSPPQGPSGLPPPGGPFPPFQQHPHSLASLAGISQSSPRQPSLQSHRPDDRPPLGAGFGLPPLSQATGQPGPAEREREQREREREVERIHIKEEEDRRYREEERRRMEQAPPHQGPPHLHQPRAVPPPTVHGPNGLLGNPSIAHQHQQQQLPQPSLGAPSGPGNIFGGGPVQNPHAHTPQHIQQASLLAPYAAGPQAQQAQQQQQQMAQGQAQGQQPILNDALSYLDQVKVQFADHPDVYNKFLDIMKDFKSGAIDTPGVIGRVSTLFAGNPDLIQGFNTFLPPGYRIECGAGDDPNSIRVTTPMGTTVQAMPQPRPLSRLGDHEGTRPSNGTYTPQPGPSSAHMAFSPSGRPLGPVTAHQHQHLSPHEAASQQEEQRAIHQQEQRGLNSLQTAVSTAAGGTSLRAGISPRASPMPGQVAADLAASGAGEEKRGPVEFNHAISYVNKIKNRFSAHPDIYKQFLEILQTYQRESKPIQDVYSQVTHLFKTAPDLLEDFKQFLPESAAAAKTAAERARQEAEGNVLISNVRNEGAGGMYSPVMSRENQMGTPGHARGLPPVGNFAPTPASKDNKRKRNDRQGTADRIPDGVPGLSSAKPQFQAQPNKRMKTQPVAKGPNDQPPTSPTLIPQLPMPLEPTTTTAANSEELGFFDKAKKAIGNKNVFNEFLKLCNLFSQDLIERSTLVYRAQMFIGGNAELVAWLKQWVGYDEKDVLIENKPRLPSGRVMLSNCRGLGPSYRLLPKRERQKPCSGRDELCNSVLNDEWASHPTWASEDSGFIAHRKNVHEEALHRIEEERHDYDFNIEACSRTIQLLEPIATSLRRMPDREQVQYTLPPGLGGQSETIYRRVIMKLYNRDKGEDVIKQLHERPYMVIPVLLNRLKERLETWKMAQREWEKVWREQTQKMFWRSLDHQAAQTKHIDRRQFQNKTLQSEVQVKYEEMKRQSHINPSLMRQPQLEYEVTDKDVVVDTAYLILSHVDSQLSTEQPKLFTFIRDFVALFFGFDADALKEEIDNRFQPSPGNEPVDDDAASGGEESTFGSARKGAAGKNGGGLLRQALNRGRKPNRTRDDSASRASTPEITSNADEEMVVDSVEDTGEKQDVSTGRWLEHPTGGNNAGSKDINPNEPQKRSLYRCWANTSIYCFIRLFLILYERLRKLKAAEQDVKKTVENASRVKPAIELGIADKLPSQYFNDTSPNANYYTQMLGMFEEVLRGEKEVGEVEDTLRRFFLQSGYQLYPFEKIITTLTRDAIQVMNSEGKDKSADIYTLFKKDRVKDTSTAQQQTDYRKSVEKMVKDSEIYRIDFESARPEGFWREDAQSPKDQFSNKVKMYLSKKDDPIGADGLTAMDRENQWRYYIASYTSVDNTDGVDISTINYPFLPSNIKAYGADPRSEIFPPVANDAHAQGVLEKSRILDVKNEEKLEVRVAVNNYKAQFAPSTFEAFYSRLAEREKGKEGVEAAEEVHSMREESVMDKFLMMNDGMRDVSKEDVERVNANFGVLVETGAEAEGNDEGAADEEEGMEVDAV
ncbi:hypothetical protein DOTSEDRAFT_71974 [Dothistroma septosporum NZE10]|uniref:Histone deacetylase interacting domain-containing protein n=1 Tax=Dothistroma septosporum (strain NZE10 / CBS 128990) TaxID=675120 RepID=N1PN21_DOTSN|nr:hypothetical protein DOTSEDRAFT_71974 [Dothistroma septosporum NZE10]